MKEHICEIINRQTNINYDVISATYDEVNGDIGALLSKLRSHITTASKNNIGNVLPEDSPESNIFRDSFYDPNNDVIGSLLKK